MCISMVISQVSVNFTLATFLNELFLTEDI